MRPLEYEIQTILTTGSGVIARRQHPELATALAWLVRCGRLQAVLPGVYAPAQLSREVTTRMRAAALWAPDSVLTGAAAASISFWPGIPVGDVELAGVESRCRSTGFRFSRRTIPAELVREHDGLRYAAPALTALDLCDANGGDGIDTALRRRAATLAGMREALALTSRRPGNSLRRELLLDSRDEPWSAAERRAHRILRSAGITGWRANLPVASAGSVYYVDIGFEEEMLALEIDGRLHESDRGLFESDRWRQNHLVLHGWRVLRFTWSMLVEHPEQFLQAVRAALALRTSPW